MEIVSNHRAYCLKRPTEQTTSVVFASPHSGRNYPRSFLRGSVLDELTIRSSEDAFVDMLVDPGVQFGAPFVAARMPRAYLDLNRASEELDPALIESVHRATHNPRIASGLGVIPRVVSNGRAIYRGKLKRDEAQRRLRHYWHPYHDLLRGLLDETRVGFGEAILVDWHSMPHEAVEAAHPNANLRPDVVIGDRFGASADSDIVDRIETVLLEAGLRVSRNTPFAGAFITQAYGRPSRKQHAIQIEIDRALYLDEARVEPSDHFDDFARLMTRVLAGITDVGRKALPMAAE